jgi:di/tricarboxylate transporter
MEAAFGIDKGEIPVDPAPFLLLIPSIALIVLITLTVPSIREKIEDTKPQGGISRSEIVCILGGVIGLILLTIAHNGAIGKVKAELGGSDISKYYHTGLGFKISVLGFISIVVMPFIGKILLNKNVSSKSSSSTRG